MINNAFHFHTDGFNLLQIINELAQLKRVHPNLDYYINVDSINQNKINNYEVLIGLTENSATSVNSAIFRTIAETYHTSGNIKPLFI